MFLIQDALCAAGGDFCEDMFGYGRDYLFVMDGASGLSGEHILPDAGSDAQWFVQRVKEALCQALDAGDCQPTQILLGQIVSQLRSEYEAAARQLGHPVPPDAPSAGLALFRQRSGAVEYFGLGDCLATVETQDGQVQSFSDAALSALDRGVVAQMEQLHCATGAPLLATRAQCQAQLLRNRALRNTLQGYWILDLTGVGLAHARQHRWEPGQVRRIGACTDGFAQLVRPFSLLADDAALHRAMASTPLQTLLDRLYAAQEADPQANRFPRLKFRDDACACTAVVDLA